MGWGRSTVLFCPCSQHRHPHVPVTGRRSPCSAHIRTCDAARWPALSPAASPPRSCGAKGQGTVVRPSAGVRSWALRQREQQCSPCTALRILPARTVSVLSLRQPSCWLRGFAATTHPRRPADSIRSASTCQGLRCSSSKAEEDTVRPLLSLSLAQELEGAAGSSKLQLHAVHPSPHPCTALHPSLHSCKTLHTPVPTQTPLHPRRLAAPASLAAPPVPRAERAAQGRGRGAPLPAAVQRTRPSLPLALEQRGDTAGLQLRVCPSSVVGTGRACSCLPGPGLSLQETWGREKLSGAADKPSSSAHEKAAVS